MLADLFLQRAHRAHVDDRDQFGRGVGMRESGCMDEAGIAPEFVLHVAAYEAFQRGAALIRHQVGRQHGFAVLHHRKRCRRIVETGLQPGEAFVAHQHQEPDLRKMFRRPGVEFVLAVLDGKGAVPGKGLALFERHRRQRLGRQALDRVAVEADDCGAVSHAVPSCPCDAGLHDFGRFLRQTGSRLPLV